MIKKILLLFIVWRILVLFNALLAPKLFSIPQESRIYLGNKMDPQAPYLAWIWGNYDGEHYLYIARWGYTGYKYAFFPLLPLVIYLINQLTGLPHLYSGLLINNLVFLLCLFIVYRIIRLDYDSDFSFKALFFLVIFPVSFYFGAIYTESFYLLFTTLSYYFARKCNWLKGGLLGILAGLTRLQGLSLIPALLVEWYQANRPVSLSKFVKTRVYLIFLVGLGIVVFAAFLQIRYGNYLLFHKSMANWQQDKFVFPLQTAWRYLKIIFLLPQKSGIVYWRAVLEFSSAVVYFLLAFYVLLKVRLSYGIFMLVSLIIPACTGTFESMPRYILHLFPAFIGIAKIASKNKMIFWSFTIIFLVLGFILTACFTRGYFIG